MGVPSSGSECLGSRSSGTGKKSGWSGVRLGSALAAAAAAAAAGAAAAAVAAAEEAAAEEEGLHPLVAHQEVGSKVLLPDLLRHVDPHAPVRVVDPLLRLVAEDAVGVADLLQTDRR